MIFLVHHIMGFLNLGTFPKPRFGLGLFCDSEKVQFYLLTQL